MTRNDRISAGIKSVIDTMMNSLMHKVLVKDPFISEVHHARKPLYAALVPDEIFKGSHFERRFVTPFGTVWEQLSKVVATEAHGVCKTGYSVTGTVRSERLRRIQETLNRLEHSSNDQLNYRPDWQTELEYILEGQGQLVPCTVICDLWIENKKSGKCFSVELKGPLPNSDQTKVSKEKIFKLLAMEERPVTMAYYALPYNPYGKREDYAWSFPNRWFDMRTDPCVLIGTDYWDLIGGPGTYRKFVDEVNNLGRDYRMRIYREYLGIEPPSDAQDYLLR